MQAENDLQTQGEMGDGFVSIKNNFILSKTSYPTFSFSSRSVSVLLRVIFAPTPSEVPHHRFFIWGVNGLMKGNGKEGKRGEGGTRDKTRSSAAVEFEVHQKL